MSPETRQIALARRRQGCGLPAGRELLDLMLRIDARAALTATCQHRTIPGMNDPEITPSVVRDEPLAGTGPGVQVGQFLPAKPGDKPLPPPPEVVMPDGFAPGLHIGDAELLAHATILDLAMAGDAAALRELPCHLRLYHTAIVETLAWRRMRRQPVPVQQVAKRKT